MRPIPRSSIPAVLLIAALCPPAPTRADEGPARVLEKVDAQLGKGFVSLPERPPLPEGDDRTLAPYLVVAGGASDGQRLPLTSVSAEVQIAGVIARVSVRQRFENRGASPIEAVYVFPGSTRAAVHGMRMKIGERVVEARIDRRDAARQRYEDAKRSGVRTSLLEQQRDNVFTMNVANLMPGDRVDVELDYSELLVPDEAVYEFVFPTVVGPRYGGGADPARDHWIASPYLPAGSAEPFPFDIKVHLESAIALKAVDCPTHPVTVRRGGPGSAEVTLAQPGGGNRDFVLRYRLAGDRIESGLLLLPPASATQDGYFVAMVEPPQRPSASQIVPREYVFVLDVSGSMYGFPLATAKALMQKLLASLHPGDWFNLVLFSGTSFTMSPHGSVPATDSSISAAVQLVDQQRGGGGTELLDALRAAYAIPRTHGDQRGLSRSVIVVTDGYVGVEAQAFAFIRDHLSEANLFSFGIGSSVNRALIEGMARAGQGEPFVVRNEAAAPAVAERLRAYVSAPVLAGIQVRFEGFDAFDVAPAHVPDLMARRPIVVFGKYRGAPRGHLRVSGMAAGAALSQQLEVASAPASAGNAPLRFLWARKWVSILDDERVVASDSKPLEEAITRLGLEHSLLTSFTSFVAVDSQVVNPGGQQQTVPQPLPLPEGVSNLAVGAAAPTMSAPGGLGPGIIGSGHGGSGAAYGYGSKMRRSASAPMLGRVAEEKAPATATPPAPPSSRPRDRDSRQQPAQAMEQARTGGRQRGTDKEVGAAAGGAGAGRAEADDSKPGKKDGSAASRPLRLTTGPVTSEQVGDVTAAVARIEEALHQALAAEPLPSGAALRVALTVDGSGHLLRLTVEASPSGDRLVRLQRALKARLAGLPLRASGADRGRLVVAFTVA